MPSQPQQGCVDGRVILATQLLGGPGPQRVGHLLHSGKRTWDCRGVKAGPPQASRVLALLRQCAKYARALGDPASPQPTWPLPRGSPTAGDMLAAWLLRPCMLLHSPGLGEHSEHCLPSSFAKHVPRELGEIQAPSSAPGSCRPLATRAGRQGASSGSGP